MRAPPLLLLALCALSACATAAPRYAVQEEGLEEVFARVQDSVVTIYTLGRTGVTDSAGQVATEGGVGSGVLIDGEGRILTAAHVVQTADLVAVEFAGGEPLEARVLGTVPLADVAMIQLTGPVPAGIRPAQLGDSGAARVASRVFVVGAPLGISHTLTVGYLSARRKVPSLVGVGFDVEVFQTDAAINQGNSGGPLFDMQGRVIGLVSYIVSQSGGSEGLGFAVTSNTARTLLLERGLFWSGMDYVVLAGPFASALNLPAGQAGLLVQRVAQGSACDRLGLRGGSIPASIEGVDLLLGGDIVLEAFGVRIGDPEGLPRILAAAGALEPESTVEVVVLRGGERLTLRARASEVAPQGAGG